MTTDTGIAAEGGQVANDRWFAQEPGDVVAALGSDADRGLSAAEAAARLTRYGPNQIAGEKPR